MNQSFGEKLILGILVPAVLAGGWTLWNINERLTRVEEGVDGLERQVFNIASVLPDLGVGRAYTAIYSPFDSALLVTEPHPATGERKVKVYVINAREQEVVTYEILAENWEDQNLGWSLIENTYDVDASAIRVAEVERFSVELEEPWIAPAYIDKGTSFLIYVDASEIEARLDILGLNRISSSATSDVRTWPELWGAIEAGEVAPPPS